MSSTDVTIVVIEIEDLEEAHVVVVNKKLMEDEICQ